MPWPQQPSMRASTQQERVADRIRALMAGQPDQAPAPVDAEASLQPQTLWEKIKELGGSLAQQPVARVAGMVGDITDEGFRGQTRDEEGWGFAGVPFGPNQVVYHGTGNAPFNKFNPAYNQPRDLFGKLTHFTEAPEYAGEVFASTRQNARVIPAKLDVKNAIDVHSWPPSQEQIDDLLKVGAIDRESAYYLTLPRIQEEAKSLSAKDMGQLAKRHLRSSLERRLKDDPLALSRAGFDGIKYGDNMGAGFNEGYSAPVWAVENPAQAKSPWSGETLGVNIKPSNLHRMLDDPSKLPTRSYDPLEIARTLDKSRPLSRVRELEYRGPGSDDISQPDWYWDDIPEGGAPQGETIMFDSPAIVGPDVTDEVFNIKDFKKWKALNKNAPDKTQSWFEFLKSLVNKTIGEEP